MEHRTTVRIPGVGILVFIIALLVAQPAIAENTDWREEVLDRVSSRMAEFDIPGLSLAVVEDGEVALLEGFGYADREDGLPVDPRRTVFRIGSVSKPLTALTVLSVASTGRLDLNADVNSLLEYEIPDFHGTSVTTAALLTHTAGVEDQYIGVLSHDAGDITSLGNWLPHHVPARFAATGEIHSYTNLGYAVAAHVAERATGADFRELARTTLFGPLGMASTTFDQVEPDGVATGYSGSAGDRTAEPLAYEHTYPAGGAFTTAADMGALTAALLGDSPVIDEEVRSAMLDPGYRPYPEVAGRTAGGLVERNVTGTRIVGHGGDIGTFAAELVLVPEENIGFFFAFNTVDLVFSDTLANDLLDVLVDVEQGSEPPTYNIGAELLDSYAGSYRWTRFGRSQADKVQAMTPPYNLFVRVRDDGQLALEFLDIDEKWVYRPIDDQAFYKVSGEPVVADGLVIDPGERIAFATGPSGKYVNLTLQTIAAEKVPIWMIGVVQISTLGVIAMLFAASLIAWPIGSWVRHRRRKEHPAGLALWVGRLTILESVMVVAALVLLFMAMGADIQFGMPALGVVSVVLFTAASVLGLAILPAAIASWVKRWFTVGERVVLTILGPVALVLFWWTNYWNLFGFRF